MTFLYRTGLILLGTGVCLTTYVENGYNITGSIGTFLGIVGFGLVVEAFVKAVKHEIDD